MVKVDDIVESLTGYLEAKIELLKLDAKNTATKTAVNVAVGAIVGVFALFMLICLTISLGLWLGSLVENNAMGFLLAAAVFLGLTLLLLGVKAALLALVQKKVFPKYQHND